MGQTRLHLGKLEEAKALLAITGDDVTVTADSNGLMGLTVDTLDEVVEVLDSLTASQIPVVATGFDGNLATSDNTVQKVAQKLDDLILAGGGLTKDADVLALTFDGTDNINTMIVGVSGSLTLSNIEALKDYTCIIFNTGQNQITVTMPTGNNTWVYAVSDTINAGEAKVLKIFNDGTRTLVFLADDLVYNDGGN